METLVQFETAMLAKEKGFNLPVADFFRKSKKPYTSRGVEYQSDRVAVSDWNNGIGCYPTLAEEVLCSAPSQYILKLYLLKTHFIYVLPIPTVTCCWTFKIIDVQCDPNNQIERPPYSGVDAYDYNTYEEAFEAGLKEALTKVNKK